MGISSSIYAAVNKTDNVIQAKGNKAAMLKLIKKSNHTLYLALAKDANIGDKFPIYGRPEQ